MSDPLPEAADAPAPGRLARWGAAVRREMAFNWRIIRSDRLGSFGALVILIAALIALFGPWLTPHDPYESLRMADGRMAVLQRPGGEFLRRAAPVVDDRLRGRCHARA